jgi:hypothetical protein
MDACLFQVLLTLQWNGEETKIIKAIGQATYTALFSLNLSDLSSLFFSTVSLEGVPSHLMTLARQS